MVCQERFVTLRKMYSENKELARKQAVLAKNTIRNSSIGRKGMVSSPGGRGRSRPSRPIYLVSLLVM